MGFDLNKWLEETINIDKVFNDAYQKVRPRILCEDSSSVSVQASEYTYCEPRYTQWKENDKWHVINGNFLDITKNPEKC